MKKTDITIPNHQRTIFGTLLMPECEGVFPIVIFSHGYNGSGRDFETISAFLAQNNIASFCYDFCGGSVHSRSSMPTTEMTIFTEKEDLHSVFGYITMLDFIQTENIFLFGGSQGGLVSALVTEELSDKIRGLILLFPAMCIADDWNNHFQSESMIPEIHNLWGMNLGKTFFTSLRGFDVFKNIGTYQRNVQIIYGANDPVVPLSYMEQLVKVYPHAKLDIFPNEGHGFSDKGNQKLADITLQFIHQNKITY